MKKFIAVLIIVMILRVSVYFYMDAESKQDDNENIFESFYAQKEIWEDSSLMPIGGIAGIYKTGYAFIDIDLDGEKELAVQLGGGTLQNCKTNFYKYENGEIKLKEFFDETYSLSINELRKFIDESNSGDFYINKYRLKIEQTKYITYYDKILKSDNGIEVYNLFTMEEVYNENSEATYTYFVNGNNVDAITYYEEYDKYFNSLEEDMLVINFISSEDWQNMSEIEQKGSLEKSYRNEDYEYVLEIKNNVVLKKDTAENIKTFDIVLDEEIYGNELIDYKKTTKINEVTAQLITDEKTFVYIIPTPDFLDNQIYYFKDGKKVAYVREFVGIGGEAEYYLKNGELIFINKDGIEESMIFTPEEDNDILIRANAIYAKYIK